MKPGLVKKIALAVMVLAVPLLVFGCGGSSKTSNTVTIGSKNFTENIVVGELMKQVLEAKTDLKVNYKANLGGTLVCWEGLKRGQLDMYPDYTGTGLMAILKRDVMYDPDEVYDLVQEEYNREYQIKWLKPFGFNNTYATAITQELSDKYNITTTSQLKPYAKDLVFCAEQEFFNRKDGYDSFISKYGLKFKSTLAMETALKYKAIGDNKAEVIDAFSTDGELVAYKLKVLEDDKQFFPPYYCAPVVRMDTLEKHPEIEDALNLLAGKISDADMQQMNYLVKEKGRKPEDVAREFLASKGML